MPTVNIYCPEGELSNQVAAMLPCLREFIAMKLTCGARRLESREVSIRVLNCDTGQMISTVELDITAYAYPERVKQEDEICREIAEFVRGKGVTSVHVWLILSELGHSWEE